MNSALLLLQGSDSILQIGPRRTSTKPVVSPFVNTCLLIVVNKGELKYDVLLKK